MRNIFISSVCLLSLFLFSCTQTHWRDLQSRIVVLRLQNGQNVPLLAPQLLSKNAPVEGLDAELVATVRSAFQEKQYGDLETKLQDIDHPQTLTTLGLLAFGSEKGTDYLERAANNYQSLEALFNLGMQAYLQQKTAQAIEYFEKATLVDDLGISFQYLGMILQSQAARSNDAFGVKKGIECLEIAANVHQIPEAFCTLGYATQSEDQTEDNASWRQLLKLEDLYKDYPAYGSLLHQIGAIYLNKHNKTIAAEYLHKAADEYDNNDALFTLSVMYLSTKSYKKACSYLKRYKAPTDTKKENKCIGLMVGYLGSENFKKAKQYADEFTTKHCIR